MLDRLNEFVRCGKNNERKRAMITDQITTIRAFLQSPAINLSQLAKEAGLSTRTLSRYRDGDRIPSLKNLIQIEITLRRLGFDLSQPPEIRSQTEDHQHPATGTD